MSYKSMGEINQQLNDIKQRKINEAIRDNLNLSQFLMMHTEKGKYPEKYMTMLKADPLFWANDIFRSNFNDIYRSFFVDVVDGVEKLLSANAMTILLTMRSNVPDNDFIKIILSGMIPVSTQAAMKRSDFRRIVDYDRIKMMYGKLKDHLCKQLSIQEGREYTPDVDNNDLIIRSDHYTPLHMYRLYWRYIKDSDDIASKLDIRHRVQSDDNYFYQLAVAIMVYADVVPYKKK